MDLQALPFFMMAQTGEIPRPMMTLGLIMLGVAFSLGALLHAFVRADKAVRVKKSFKSKKEYFAFYAVSLMVRSAIETAFFWLYVKYPDVCTKLVAHFGFPNIKLDIPLVLPVAFLLGYIADSLLDYAQTRIPYLRKEIPQLDSDSEDGNDKTT